MTVCERDNSQMKNNFINGPRSDIMIEWSTFTPRPHHVKPFSELETYRTVKPSLGKP